MVLRTNQQRPRVVGSGWYDTPFFFCPWYPSKLSRGSKDINECITVCGR